MKTETPRPVRLEDYRPSPYLIDTVDLDIALNPTATRVRSKLHIRPNPAYRGRATVLALDGEGLTLESIALDGKPLPSDRYRQTATKLSLAKLPDRPFVVETVVIINPEANTALQGLYRSRGVFCTQCEAEGFRHITFFVDRPDILSVYTTRIEADAKLAPVLLGNGNPVASGKLDRGKRHFAVWHDPHPKPCYLFALVGGDLAAVRSKFKTKSGRAVELAIFVEHGKEARAEWAMDSLKRSMTWDERRFGREYDLDVFNIVAVSDFNMGAMENKGLNIFNDRLILASPETATDAMFEAIESVVAHEYFHNWTGNRITCRDWFQLCLKEGLTVYRDQEFSSDERDPTVQRIQDVRQLKATQFPEDSGPLAHPVRPASYIEINNFYTPTVYEKGAELVRMIETLLGKKKFRAGMDLYFDRHDGQAATIEDFLTCFENASGRDLSQFKLWYLQAGTPEIVASLVWDRATKTASLRIEQMQPTTPGQTRKQPLHIPLRLALLGGNGQPIELKLANGEPVSNGVLEITKRTETFRFTDVPSRPVPSLLQGFSAPVRLTMDLSDRDLEFLIANDADLFNRWQAASTYAIRSLKTNVALLSEGKRATRGLGFANSLRLAIADSDLNPAYRAELLRLPSQADIAREIGKNIDPAIIHRAHTHLSKLVAGILGDDLEAIYASLAPRGPFSPDARSAGKRALRNAALTLLAARGEPEDMKRVLNHFRKAASMTDQAHALILISSLPVAEREHAFAAFHDRWKDDHLVIDTWFAAQAQSTLPDTLERVRALTSHPLFSYAMPNKVRALIGNFALQNPLQFNSPDGAGYTFVADEVLKIDAVNPQIAARMLGCFRSWKLLEAGRRALARKALQKVAGSATISRDVFEIVTKMLAA
ncbi:MAG: aminopeptidase N [Hyphomicrobium sp.]|jgi:aminopeptidase N|nr:aminopeptidase N [Hyphomicrobium sp.]